MMHPQPANLWDSIAVAHAARQTLVVATIVSDSGSVPRRTGTKMVILPDGTTQGTVGGGIFEQLVIRDGLALLAARLKASNAPIGAVRPYSFNPRGANDEAFGAICGGRAEVFLEIVMPADRLLIVGGGHCGKALAQAASLLDFSIVIADDRAEYSKPEDYAFAGVDKVLHLPADFKGLPVPDAQTYVALVSKGFLTDEAALRQVIHSPAAYIGMIGSVKKRDTVYQKLRADGISDELLARVHSPIGLEIGGDTPAEIAISILAQIVQVRSKLKAAPAGGQG